LRQAFHDIGHVDIAVTNAGVSQECHYFIDTYDEHGELEELEYRVIDVNYRAVLNFTKLALRAFRQQGPGGSLVITSSSTAYSSEQSLPVYSSTKLGLIGLVRAIRSTVPKIAATINAVAPGATITKLLPQNLAKPTIAAGAPVSSAHHVGLAVAYAAVASQSHQVEGYGKDTPEILNSNGRWNGCVILTPVDRWPELREPIADLRRHWFGEWNTNITVFQQRLTDMR
ncbi:Short chain dehydrogenase reductase family, partial [Penicillium paradoxum]|uniref:Short chain dehydrogenase reductase family n=1 Tax=Penicillium paradoxum TaxID=176176 RepID=UPI002549A198